MSNPNIRTIQTKQGAQRHTDGSTYATDGDGILRKVHTTDVDAAGNYRPDCCPHTDRCDHKR